jgi:hypothetical protein
LRRTLVALAVAIAAGAALAAIPSPERLAGAVAEANELAGRADPLLLNVSLRVAGAGPSAAGEIATHPTGLARLELRSPAGFVERHLLLGDDYSASRDGRLLDRPHPFLPPVFLLQASSAATLSAALVSFGVFANEVVLGRMGDHDCYVFGGRRVPGPAEGEPLLPSLWVDTSSLDALRVVRADGTEYRLGPTQVYDGIRLPRWIDIREGGSPRARLEIVSAARADAPAAVFQSEWLTASGAAAERPEPPGPTQTSPLTP